MTTQVMVQSLLGGTLIGLSAALLLLGRGQIAGISGIVGNLARGQQGAGAWRVLFVVGMFASPLLYVLVAGTGVPGALALPLPLILLAGALVGFGTRQASGCTSGHGVCGLGNFSARSLVAVMLFMGSAAVTVFVVRHVVGA